MVLKLLQVNQSSTKHSKCSFGCDKVEYLGHFISKYGVQTNPAKAEAVQEWLVPQTLKQLHGFS